MANKPHTVEFMDAVRLVIASDSLLQRDMALIQERRKMPQKDMAGVGRWGIAIPNPLLYLFKVYKPELFQEDEELAAREWLKFMKHEDSIIFQVGYTQ